MKKQSATHPSNNQIIQISPSLFLIPLFPPIPGFDNFIGAWVYKGEETFLVDVGPSVTVPSLIAALHDLDVECLDYILLTHIHIDHAGGIGHFTSHYPQTPIVCHPAGIPHLADPTRLYEGSVKTLGDMAIAYGTITPVPMERLVDAERFSSKCIRPIITLGHSAHHVSYHTPECLFAGETGGVCLSLASGDTYLRPATPTPFYLNTQLESLDRLTTENPSLMCYGHFGVTQQGGEMLKRHREQLILWEHIIGKKMGLADQDEFIEQCIDTLLKEDPQLAGFFQMDPAIRKRELNFFVNSIKGFAGHLKRAGKTP